MHWEILTKSDILISELDNTFLEDTRDIKMCYFTDGKTFCGIKDDLHFFVNNTTYDFKLNQKLKRFFQYKTARYNLFYNKEDVVYNVGMETEDDSGQYKYVMQIENDSIIVVAQHFFDNQIKSKTIKLR